MPALGALPMLPPPGALSAAQLSAMTSAVAAQRGSIEGLVAQLRAFDEQLEVLERILGPLAEWSRTWAEHGAQHDAARAAPAAEPRSREQR